MTNDVILVTGSTGQLGKDVIIELEKRNIKYLSPKRNELDLSSKKSIINYFSFSDFDYVLHCAAWTNVELAETEAEKCRKINVDATEIITKECIKKDIPILFVSTDYVFDGTGTKPWDVDDKTNPINTYGLSKRDGEEIIKTHMKHYIVRISWVFGINGKNFAKKIIDLSKKEKISVVCDQIGSPTYAKDVASLLIDILFSNKYGTYHAHNEGYCSWNEFATEIMNLIGSDTIIEKIESKTFKSMAKRPLNGRLDTTSLTNNGFKLLPGWKDATRRFIDELNENNQS